MSRLASPLVDAHIEGERRIRLFVTRGVEQIWRDLPGYDRKDVDRWLSQVIPVVLSGQRASVALTDGFIARVMKRPPLGLNPDELIGAALRGVPPEEVYARPMTTVWTALANGSLYDDAVASGMARATEMAAFDVQASMRATAGAAQRADQNIYGWERVANAGACDYCAEIDGAFVKNGDAAALHPECGCGLFPLTSPKAEGGISAERAAGWKGFTQQSAEGVSVHQHGEMGAVLGSSEHSFTGPSEL